MRVDKKTVWLSVAAGAALVSGGLGASFRAEVRQPVVIEPPAATVPIGDTLRLSASLLDDSGTEAADQRFTWWSPNPDVATVSSVGLVRAVGIGAVDIAAVSADRSQSGFASVTVVAGPEAAESRPESRPTTVPVAGRAAGQERSDAGPNEPPGLNYITGRPFQDYDENGWSDRHDGGVQSVSNGVARITYRAGFVGGSAPGSSSARLPGDGYRTVYLGFEYMLSANWQGHGSSMNKIWYLAGNGGTFATVKAWGGPGTNQFPILVTAKQTKRPLAGNSGANFQPNVAKVGLRRGQRALVEILVTMNSDPDTYDGELIVWVDGVKTHEYTPARGSGIRWGDGRPNQSRQIDQLKWTPVWGGGRGSKVAESMYAELSYLYVSGR